MVHNMNNWPSAFVISVCIVVWAAFGLTNHDMPWFVVLTTIMGFLWGLLNTLSISTKILNETNALAWEKTRAEIRLLELKANRINLDCELIVRKEAEK